MDSGVASCCRKSSFSCRRDMGLLIHLVEQSFRHLIWLVKGPDAFRNQFSSLYWPTNSWVSLFIKCGKYSPFAPAPLVCTGFRTLPAQVLRCLHLIFLIFPIFGFAVLMQCSIGNCATLGEAPSFSVCLIPEIGKQDEENCAIDPDEVNEDGVLVIAA